MNKALFLDRDGVINKEINYLHRIEEVVFLDGIFEICQHFQSLGFLIIVITNQAGIARGYYTEAEFLQVTDWMTQQFKKKGIEITRVYYCPYHPTEGKGKYRADSYDRKPNPGMILKAKDEFDLDLKKSILIGDKESDIEAGIQAHVGTNVLIKSAATHNFSKADMIIDSLKQLPNLFDA